MKTCFPDAKQIKIFPKLLYAKNVNMFKNIDMKVMRFFITHQIMNLKFHHQNFHKEPIVNVETMEDKLKRNELA